MYNYFMLVGEIKGINKNEMVLEITRPFKNQEMKYETDVFKVQVNEFLYDAITEYAKISSIIGVKGRIENSLLGLQLQVEKFVFLDGNTK